MASDFAKSLLKVSVAQICQNIGWHAVQGSPLEVLVDILHRYLFEIAKTAHQYSNQYGRVEPNIVDLSLAFRLMGIQLHELEEYVNNVEPVPFVHQVAAFPLPHRSNFQFPRANSRSVAQRPEWITEHLPLAHPEPEDEDPPPCSPPPEDPSKIIHTLDTSSDESSDDLSSSPLLPSKQNGSEPHHKRRKYNHEDEGRPMRELVSIFVTPSGLISQGREGRGPDPRAPSKVLESQPPSPEIVTGSSSSSSISLPNLPLKKPFKPIKKDKAKMLKLKKDLVLKKQMKKLKLLKKEPKSIGALNPLEVKDILFPAPIFMKKDGRNIVIGDPVKIKPKKKKSSSDLNKLTSKLKPVINKIRIAKDKTLTMPKEFVKGSKAKKPHSGSSNIPLGPRSPKSPKGAKFSSLPKSSSGIRSPKISPLPGIQKEKPPIAKVPPPVLPAPKIPPLPEPQESFIPVKIEPLQQSKAVFASSRKEVIRLPDIDDEEDNPSREDTPEPRLVIDDEAQARQEKESRMAVLDECIDAVIMRATEEMLEEDKNMDDAINSVIKSSKKLEPKDVYDFTSDEGDSLPQTPKTPEPASSPPAKMPKKEKIQKTPEVASKLGPSGSDSGKKKKSKTASKKKTTKDKPKPPPLSFSKFGRSGTQRAPSPTFDDSDSSDIQSLPSPSPPSGSNQMSPILNRNNFGQFPQPSSLFSTAMTPHKFPSMAFSPSPSPFSPLRSLPSNPFPTPPLFVPVSKSEQLGSAQVHPLNLAMSPGSGSNRSLGEKKAGSSSGTQESLRKAIKIEDEVDKGKNKDHKKRPEKKEKPKKKAKIKTKKETITPLPPPPPPPPPPTPPPPPPPPVLPPPPPVVTIPEAKKSLPEKKPEKVPKPKPEKKTKATKADKEKKKGKEEKEKVKEDPNSIPKITFKLGGNAPHTSTGSAKIVIKSANKAVVENHSPPEVSTVSPVPSPPPAPLPSTKPPTPPPPVIPPAPLSPPTLPVRSPPAGRGRQGNRGRGAAKQRAPSPTPCIVTTETLGTIVDASGNKIWICPACTRPDDGSPMIGCDECDDWYHWVCVGIVVPPKEEESWFCTRCISKRQGTVSKKRRKKHRKEK